MKKLPFPSFTDTFARRVLREIDGKKEPFWQKMQERNTLRLFHAMSTRVPAYGDFLKRHHIKPEHIRTWSDFQNIPAVDKKNYLRQYPLPELCWDGVLDHSMVFSATSGSTGKPFYFPRNQSLAWQHSLHLEQFLKQSLRDNAHPTLVLDCFGMGVWIAGIITYHALEIESIRKFPVSILTTGLNKIEILNALREIAPKFKQTILVGYPPFIKDVLDEAAADGVDVKGLGIRLIFAAEGFTETFRDYMAVHCSMTSVYHDSFNIYGSADLGAMATETPTAILARRLILSDKNVREKVWGGTYKVPTLVQYNPYFIGFEEVDGEILVSGNSALPLVRYAIGDRGGVMGVSQVRRVLEGESVNFDEEAKENKVHVQELPFVYVYERTDFSTNLYGIQIYPEMIREVFLSREAGLFLTGKFMLETSYDSNHDQHIVVHLEQRKGIEKPSEADDQQILRLVLGALRERSSEFRELTAQIGDRSLIRLKYWPAEHPDYFAFDRKQQWVKKKQ